MTNGSELKSKGAQALRAAGFKPCPRWWLKDDQLELVAYMAEQNREEVNKIRSEANRASLTKAQEIDRAWKTIGKAST